MAFGPLGKAYAAKNTPDSLWAALVATGSVLFGNKQEIKEVVGFLNKEETSRTTSYLCGMAKSCKDIVNFHTKINNTSIAFLGLGGIGSLTTIILSGLGIKKFLIVEPDKIELSNLNRQFLFTKKDIGKFKADTLKTAMNERYEKLKVKTIKERIQNNEQQIKS